MRLLPLLILAGVVLAGCSSAPTITTDGPLGPALSLAQGFRAPVNMTKVGSARETSLVVDPTNAQHIFACDPSGVPAVNNGHSYFYESRDGGATWTDVQVESSPTDPRQATFEGGDCDVAFDAKGTMYTADTWLGAIAVGSNSGEGWTGDTVDAGGPPVADRPWLVGGPDGTVYLTYQDVQFGMPATIWFTKSTDHGRTFSPASSVATATPDGLFTWTGNFVVSSDGRTIHTVHTRRVSGVLAMPGDSGAERVEVTSSHDGGMTWSTALVSARPASASYLYPAIAMDLAGQLHVVFSQAADKDQPTWYSRSLDDGKTWSEPIPLQRGVMTGSPWVATLGPGHAVVEYEGFAPKGADNDASNTQDWFLYTAQVVNGTVVSAQPTTQAPLFHGKQGAYPEFNQVRVGPDGAIHIGASIAFPTQDGSGYAWQAVHQWQAPA